MKRLIALTQVALMEMGARCGTSTILDAKTLEERCEHEGISFLTISLPKFCSDLEKSLDQGLVGHDRFIGFSRTGGLPRFLGGFLDQVFNRKDGRLLDEPSVHAIQAIRQICLLSGKIEIRCTPERETAALRKYIECEQDVRWYDDELIAQPDRLSEYVRIGRLLWAEFFTAVDGSVYDDGVLPKHGPGATADKLRGNAKYNQRTWTRRMEEVFPHWENLIPSTSLLERTDGVTILEPEDEVPVKVILVPKTLKTPRVIAVEPTCMQYMQQGVLATLVKQTPRFDNTRNFICSKSQKPNQWLAREGSVSGALATLDLSEASDRVSNQHVRLLVANHRELRRAVDATRSRKAVVPGVGIIPLAKFASMGSALCFPFEAMVFTTIIFLGISRASRRPLTKGDIKSYFGKVRCYGDDIIVPVEFVQPVIQELEAFGLKVNANKSFWTGKFRESCGKEYYDGTDVCVARVRRDLPKDRTQTEELISTVEFRNRWFHLFGNGPMIDHLDEMVQKIIPYPYVEWGLDSDGNVASSSPLLGRHADCMPMQRIRYDNDYQVPLVRGAVAVSKLPASQLDDYGALMKFFLKVGEEPIFDRRHLQFAGRANSTRVKVGWYSPG